MTKEQFILELYRIRHRNRKEAFVERRLINPYYRLKGEGYLPIKEGECANCYVPIYEGDDYHAIDMPWTDFGLL